ncbi:hypothetical protein JXA88_06495 [Candidatus Fermentibacteria bacterium]|nr:hypothetical protein [Candidatus Fermentibacteria bacterium]
MYRLVASLFGLAWILLLIPGGETALAAMALSTAGLCLLFYGAQRHAHGLLLATTAVSSIGVAFSHHAGVLLLAWVVSGGSLTYVVRREGGETSGKPGRVLELQQHISSVLLLLALAGIVVVGQSWDLAASPPVHRLWDRIMWLLAGAGVQKSARIWDAVLTTLVASAAVFRLGVFPFPFSLRRSARRLHGIPLLILLAVFLPTSMCAVARLSFGAETYGAISLGSVATILGAIALVTGALLLQAEWLGESIIGLVAQCYVGLALLGIGSGESMRTTMVVIQASIACGVGGLWTMRLRSLAQTSDLAKASGGYARHRELQLWHGVFVMAACPWPGTPGGLIWMCVLGRSIAAGTGFGLVVLLGITLLYCGLFRSIGKVSVRLGLVGATPAPSPQRMEPQVERT